ncbi:MAG: hypothetical protein DWQ04_03935 [Chloroflexi bacterium]|nr:MAG: hypothetical protein DWQ04_03935 [Chloroflexota bacterium]
MRKKYTLLQIGNIPITTTQLALVSSLVLWIVFALIGALGFQLSLGSSILGGLLAMVLHWVSELLHQLGHAWVASRVGYPMREIRLLHLLAGSVYPRDEPDLPAKIHIRRALGGPPVSFGLAGVGALVLFLQQADSGLSYLLAQFVFWENLLVFGLGSLLPLGFTDGSTLLEWWPKRNL